MKWWCVLLLCLPLGAQSEEFNFDISNYEKPRYELNGYLEALTSRSSLDTDSALYNLQTFDLGQPDTLLQRQATIQLEGVYRFTESRLQARYLAQAQNMDTFGYQTQSVFHEVYYSDNHFKNLTIDIGKRVQKWGKGYAWNPVGFVERKKDPNDPDLSREGYVMLDADYVRSLDGDLKTLAITPVILPVTKDINNDYSNKEDTNYAAKLYLLYRDIDLDFMMLAKGSQSAKYGMDFSGNVSSSFELHGELAYIADQQVAILDSANSLVTSSRNSIQSLLGFRYLTENETTIIGEYYHNGAGYSEQELTQFYKLAGSDFSLDPSLLVPARRASNAGYGKANPGRDYLYISAVIKEPYQLVYFNIGAFSIVNIADQSYSLTPELSYSGVNNTELRLRLTMLRGGANTEFGEKVNQQKIELRFRYFF